MVASLRVVMLQKLACSAEIQTDYNPLILVPFPALLCIGLAPANGLGLQSRRIGGQRPQEVASVLLLWTWAGEARHKPDTGQGVELTFLGAGSSTLEIFYYADPGKRDRAPLGRLDHTAWYVDDVKATMARLAAEGAAFRPNDPAPTSDGGLMAFTTGPDGERVELTQRP